jgi:hypothetical protein
VEFKIGDHVRITRTDLATGAVCRWEGVITGLVTAADHARQLAAQGRTDTHSYAGLAGVELRGVALHKQGAGADPHVYMWLALGEVCGFSTVIEPLI